jgi:hypothetical protein
MGDVEGSIAKRCAAAIMATSSPTNALFLYSPFRRLGWRILSHHAMTPLQFILSINFIV